MTSETGGFGTACASATCVRAERVSASAWDYYALTKPRVMQLVVFTAFAGMFARMASAPSDLHPFAALAALVCIAAGAGAAGALNMWWDADIDATMHRTRARPIPSGKLTGREALGFGLGLAVLSVTMLGVFANPAAAGLLAFTIAFYAVIYSMWLKRATPHNIVIGGASGALPPIVAWVAVGGEVSTAPILMFTVIFLWTPPHFWALALFRSDDYARAGVPMMPVAAGEASTRRQIWLYTLALAPAPTALAFTSAGGPITLLAAVCANALILQRAWAVRGASKGGDNPGGEFRAEKRLFAASILYLFAIFGAVVADAALRLAVGPFWPQLL